MAVAICVYPVGGFTCVSPVPPQQTSKAGTLSWLTRGWYTIRLGLRLLCRRPLSLLCPFYVFFKLVTQLMDHTTFLFTRYLLSSRSFPCPPTGLNTTRVSGSSLGSDLHPPRHPWTPTSQVRLPWRSWLPRSHGHLLSSPLLRSLH